MASKKPKKNYGELVVKSKVKELIKSNSMNASADIFDGLGDIVADHIERAVKRAKENGRKTLRTYDF